MIEKIEGRYSLSELISLVASLIFLFTLVIINNLEVVELFVPGGILGGFALLFISFLNIQYSFIDIKHRMFLSYCTIILSIVTIVFFSLLALFFVEVERVIIATAFILATIFVYFILTLLIPWPSSLKKKIQF